MPRSPILGLDFKKVPSAIYTINHINDRILGKAVIIFRLCWLCICTPTDRPRSINDIVQQDLRSPNQRNTVSNEHGYQINELHQSHPEIQRIFKLYQMNLVMIETNLGEIDRLE
ncbi:unnamed protein product [Dibothriocephalus latus]|uniref:Uncharacterized protein n=1 Tax=Dibothriocephalus latus TaxID=60516 RepID=A0A3P6V049_DIBLA|nr:unnamed protein product [Dibothriocephalus latus]